MKTKICPDRESLQQLLLGKLPRPQAEPIEEHLLHCDHCSALADTISAGDELTAAIQSPDDYEDDENLDRAIQQAKQLRAQAETSEIDETLNTENLPQPDSAPEASADRPGTDLDEEIDFLAPAEQPNEIGRLGDYRVLEVLGVGGMGVVFRAEDPKLKRQVALKAMKPAVAASRSAKERFLREAQATASIEHDNIVRIYQVGEDSGVPFIAMEFLRGESLQTCLKREKKLDQRDVLRIGREIAQGLAAAHDRGLIHRDIKPDNVWIEAESGRAKILDFGLVRAAGDDAGLTRTGVVVGTPKYMAPEQAQGQSVDHRCDLFSLGSVLYHLATGKAPFAGGNITATLMAVASEDPQAADEISPEIDPELARLIMRLLSKDPEQRPQSAAEVASAIKHIEARMAAEQSEAAEHSSLAPTTSLPQIATRSVSEAPIQARGASKGKQRSRRRPPRFPRPRVGLLCAGGAALLLVAGTIFFIPTKDGTIRVEINDPNIEVSIKGTEIVLKQADQGKDTTLSPGEKTLIVQRGDFKFETGKLILKKGETVMVRVELLAGKIQVRQGEKLIGEKSVAELAKSSGASGKTPKSGDSGYKSDPPPPAIAPFDAEQAKKHQQAWADHLGVPFKKEVDLGGGVKIAMVLIPPGEFLMGSTDEERARWLNEATAAKDQTAIDNIPGEGPQHHMRLTKPFYMAVHEVTQEQYQRVMGTNPSQYSSSGARKTMVAGQFTNRHPVERVSWLDAVDFCNKLSAFQKQRPGNGFRLPTEAEWEYSCRAGSTGAYYCADESELGNYGWCGVNSAGKTRAVGEKLPNGFGLHDMHGSVYEWCWDVYDGKYYQKLGEADVLDPFGPTAGSDRVNRGGCWVFSAWLCRSAFRYWHPPAYRGDFLGFRLALVLAE